MTTLADRLRSAEIEVAQLNFEAIESAIERSVEGTSMAGLPDLVRLAHRKTPRNDSFLTAFQAPFHGADSTLLLDGEDELGAALACAVLTELFQGKCDDNLTHGAAMLIKSASFLQWQPKVPDLPDAAETHLQSAGDEIRKRTRVPEIRVEFRKFDEAIKIITTACEQNSAPGMKDQLPQTLTSLRDSLRALCAGANNAIAAVDKNQDRSDEELDIFWWVASGHSQLLEAPLSKAPKAAIPLVAGIELADLVAFVPGPPAAAAFLSTVLRGARVEASRPSLKDAVTALPDTVPLEVPATLHSNPEFCPLAFAVTRHREAGDASWTSAFSKQTELDLSEALEPLSLSVQAYNERVLGSRFGMTDD